MNNILKLGISLTLSTAGLFAALPTFAATTFTWPVHQGYIARIQSHESDGLLTQSAITFWLKARVEVTAAYSGTVTAVRPMTEINSFRKFERDNSSSKYRKPGSIVRITADDGTVIVYRNLRTTLEVGDAVVQGDVIGIPSVYHKKPYFSPVTNIFHEGYTIGQFTFFAEDAEGNALALFKDGYLNEVDFK